jgi:hypothetical protein
MNKKDIYFGRNNVRFIYLRYKDSSYFTLTVIVLIIVMCVLLVLTFILPQFDQWLSIRQEVIATRERTNTINDNIEYLNNLDRRLLVSQTGAVSSALPSEKNFGSILDALSASALRAGVSFQDYSFEVGNISTTSAKLQNARIKGLSAVNVTLAVDGTVDQVKIFLQEAAKALPLSEVTAVEGSEGTLNITFEFFQKGLPKVTLHDDQPVPRVINNQATLINQLTSWQALPAADNENAPGASKSGLPLF